MSSFRFLVLAGLLALTTPLHAATLKSESEAEALADRVMQAVGKNELDVAYGLLKQHSVLPAAELDSGLQATKAQRNAQFRERYGASVGYEHISKKSLGKSMMRLVYIEKTQKHPLPWAFFFYQTPSGWALTQVGWDDQAAALFAAN